MWRKTGFVAAAGEHNPQKLPCLLNPPPTIWRGLPLSSVPPCPPGSGRLQIYRQHQWRARWVNGRWRLSHCWGSSEQKVPAVLWTLGYWVRVGESVKFYQVFPPSHSHREALAEKPEDLCQKPHVKRSRNKGVWARYAYMHRVWLAENLAS